MQINATQIRKGMILIIDDELYKVTWTMHRTPGKGNACMQTKLKNIINNRNLERRFLSSERVERATLETKSMQYLYKDSSGFIFMDNETYDQISVSEELVGEDEKYLQENINVTLNFHDEKAVGIQLPQTMDFEVSSAPPEIKKATASASLRPITLINGMVIQAPVFIKTGDIVKVNTESGDYVERVS
ncbi:elongation factor P [Candidatus Marinamargulisbacteria bacterium SCGC AG-410-N11]|nr:elongation factor P [Candidatus Marinamargulisbacteria bacterium SCGC AG-410-N11]